MLQLPHGAPILLVWVHTVEFAVGGRLSPPVIRDAILDRQLGADQRLTAYIDEIGIVVQRPNDMAGQLRSLGGFQ
jgi:hypothetical protein